MLTAFAAARVLPLDGKATATFDGLIAQRIRIRTMDSRVASIALSRHQSESLSLMNASALLGFIGMIN